MASAEFGLYALNEKNAKISITNIFRLSRSTENIYSIKSKFLYQEVE